MFEYNLKKVFDLVKKTNDRVVVVPVPGTRDDEPYVIVPFNQYEGMLKDEVDYKSMTEEEALNRINREMTLWKQSQRELGFDPDMDFLQKIQEDKGKVANISPTVDDWGDQDDGEEEEEELDVEELTDLDDDLDEYTRKMRDLDEQEPDYEQVPPPPDLQKKEELPVIDMSFKESDDVLADIKNNEEEDNDFLVEPIE
ncbi:MAG: hypothetical protein ABIA91_02830 [Patescibacteria group bacterium]